MGTKDKTSYTVEVYTACSDLLRELKRALPKFEYNVESTVIFDYLKNYYQLNEFKIYAKSLTNIMMLIDIKTGKELERLYNILCSVN